MNVTADNTGNDPLENIDFDSTVNSSNNNALIDNSNDYNNNNQNNNEINDNNNSSYNDDDSDDKKSTQYPVEMLHTFDNYNLEDSMNATDSNKKNISHANDKINDTNQIDIYEEMDDDDTTLNMNSIPLNRENTNSKNTSTTTATNITKADNNTTNKSTTNSNKHSKKYKWNQLPINGITCLIKASKYNTINIQIDNQIKQFKYNPKWNSNLTLMDIFYTFNKETEPIDSLLYSRERLKEFSTLLIEALDTASNQSITSTKTLLNKSVPPGKSSILSTYSKEASDFLSADFSETGTVLHLWYLQLTKFLLQKDSLFYSNDALQSLLKKKYDFIDNNKPNKKNNSNKNISTDNTNNKNSSTAGQNNEYKNNSKSSLSSSNLNEHNNNNNNSNIDTKNTNKSNVLDDIDILVIRPSFASIISWQLAIDEPTLNIVDFQLNPAPLETLVKESRPDIILDRLGRVVKELSSLSMVCNEDELQELDNSNINKYLFDCMGRPIDQSNTDKMDSNETLTDSIENLNLNPNQLSTANSKSNNNSNNTMSNLEKYDSSSTNFKFQNNNDTNETLPPFLADDKDGKKKNSTKKSSIMKFFRRKHPANNSSTNLSQSFKKPVIESITSINSVGSSGSSGSASAGTTSTFGMSTSTRMAPPLLSKKIQTSRTLLNDSTLSSYDTTFLENFFVNELNNFKSISMTTQYYLPNKAGLPHSHEMTNSFSDTSNESFSSNENNSSSSSDNTSSNYNREYLQLKLPFKDNSIPVIYSPWIWGHLNRTKWNSLAKEIYRILKPEGYILAFQNDLVPSNYSLEQDENFKSTMATNGLYNSVIVDVIKQKFYIHPTKHLPNIFKQYGFTNIKSSTLTLKLGDLKTEMGCLNQFVALMDLNFVFRHGFSDQDGSNENTNLGDILQEYIDEHWGKIDDNSGTTRIVYMVAQKPKDSYVS